MRQRGFACCAADLQAATSAGAGGLLEEQRASLRDAVAGLCFARFASNAGHNGKALQYDGWLLASFVVLRGRVAAAVAGGASRSHTLQLLDDEAERVVTLRDRERSSLLRAIVARADPAYAPDEFLEEVAQPRVHELLLQRLWPLRLVFGHFGRDDRITSAAVLSALVAFGHVGPAARSGVNPPSVVATFDEVASSEGGDATLRFPGFVECVCRLAILFFPVQGRFSSSSFAVAQNSPRPRTA